MPFTFPSRTARWRTFWIVSLCALAPLLRAQDSATEEENDSALAGTAQALESLIDRLPDLLDLGLPGFARTGAVQLIARPRFGDLLHEDYFRLPVGVRVQALEHWEIRSEARTYFTHGLRDSAGYGLYEVQAGVKREWPITEQTGWASGVDFVTAVSRPPPGITDGMRHWVPYISNSFDLMPSKDVLGFATLSADLISRTSLPPDFRKNQLRQDSLMLTVGAARDFARFRVIVAASIGDTTLLSSSSEQVYALRPSIVIPILKRKDNTARAQLTFGGRAVWGPDGSDFGVNTSVRVDLRYNAGRKR